MDLKLDSSAYPRSALRGGTKARQRRDAIEMEHEARQKTRANYHRQQLTDWEKDQRRSFKVHQSEHTKPILPPARKPKRPKAIVVPLDRSVGQARPRRIPVSVVGLGEAI